MDSINNYRPTKVAPQFKMLDPWGKMTDGVPVQFRQGGTVQYK
jgi:hypothetical protein